MMRSTVAGLVAVAAVTVTDASFAAKTRDYRLEAEMRFLGMNVGRVELEAAANGDTRDQRLAMATTGLVQRLTGFKGELTARSRTGEGAPETLDFRSFTETDRATREVELRYDGAGRVVEVATFKRGEPRGTEVPEAMRDGTMDPLTALAAVRGWLVEVRDDPPAETTLAIFDGRRRYDLHVSLVDRRTAEFASGPTPVLEVRLESEPLAGFDDDSDGRRPITVLMSDDDVVVPLVMRTEVMGDLEAALYTKRVCAAPAAEPACREYRY